MDLPLVSKHGSSDNGKHFRLKKIYIGWNSHQKLGDNESGWL